MLRASSILILCMSLLTSPPAVAEEPESTGDTERWIISSGAVANLPAGSLVSIAVALERGVQAIKLDLTLSSDDQVMVLLDPRLNDTTTVEQHYPERAREDGSYYSVDFTRAELKVLAHHSKKAPDRAPASSFVFTPEFPVIGLDEALGYLDRTRTDPDHRPIVVCELRMGWLHRREGKELAQAVYTLLEEYHRRSGNATLYLASYDPEELQRLAETKHPDESGVRFIQLIGDNDGSQVKTLEFGRYQPYNYDLLFTKFGLKAISTYAAAIGLEPQTILDRSGAVIRPDYLEDARRLGMDVILYGEPPDLQPDAVPDPAASSVLDHLFFTAGFNAILSDDAGLIGTWRQPTETARESNVEETTIERLIRQIERGSAGQPGSGQSGTNW